jgi:hypothetical protein
MIERTRCLIDKDLQAPSLGQGVELKVWILLTRGNSGVPEQITHASKVPETFSHGVVGR